MRNSMRRSFAMLTVAQAHFALQFDCAAHRIDNACKLDQQTVASGFDDAAMVLSDLRIDQLPSQHLQAFKRAFLVGSHQP
jgi:hypothetical protein